MAHINNFYKWKKRIVVSWKIMKFDFMQLLSSGCDIFFL